MSITSELRTSGVYSFPSNTRRYTLEELTAIADRIDAEHEAKVSYWQGASYKDGYDEGFASADDWLGQHEDAMAEHGWVRLPKDADGVPIHVGDMMERGKARGHVTALMLSEYPKKWGGELHWGVQLEGEQAPTALDAFFHHYHKPTVEDVLRGVVTLCHNTWKKESAFEFYDVDDVMESGNIADFAAKLQLREGA